MQDRRKGFLGYFFFRMLCSPNPRRKDQTKNHYRPITNLTYEINEKKEFITQKEKSHAEGLS